MKTIKSTSKLGQRFINSFNSAIENDFLCLGSVYSSYSRAKALAWSSCFRLCFADCERFGTFEVSPMYIISHNTFHFTCACNF